MRKQLDPPSPPEQGLWGLRELREAAELPPEALRVAELQENMIALSLDVGCFARAMAEAPGEWDLRLFGRHLALTLYEGLDDLATLVPAATQEFVKTPTPEAAEARRRLRGLSKSLSALRRKYAADLEPVRNAAAAHRDHDMGAFHSAVDALDLGRLALAASELHNWTAKASATLLAVLFRYSGVQADLAQQFERIADGIAERS